MSNCFIFTPMKRSVLLLLCFALLGSVCAIAQSEGKPRPSDKSDIILFHRQILTLKEYNDERAKIPSLQKANKVTVRVRGIVDTTEMDNEGEDDAKPSKKLTGYIRQEMGDNSVDLYQLTFDRVKKKITAVIPTGESLGSAKVTPKATKASSKTPNKKKDEEDDDDDDDKPGKKKEVDKDDDN